MLCRLSFFAQVRRRMLTVPGLLEVVIALSREHDTGTQHRCLAILCNLAREPALRPALVSTGAVRALVALTSVHDEEVRRGCAAALCNLSADAFEGAPECRARVVQEGAVQALVILGLVASSSPETARLTAKVRGTLTALLAHSGRTALQPRCTVTH